MPAGGSRTALARRDQAREMVTQGAARSLAACESSSLQCSF
jgi:hypothetical protein